MKDFSIDIDWPDWASRLPEPFQREFMHTAVWQWLGILVLIAIGYLAYRIGRGVARALFKLRARFTNAPMSPSTDAAVRRAMGFLLAVFVSYPILDELSLHNKILTFCQSVLSALTILAISLLAYAVWDMLCDDIAHRAAGSQKAERLLVPMARKFVRAIIVTIALLVASSDLFKFDVRGVVASLGIGGLVVALAAKDSVENVFGSLTILFDMPFAIGDWVRIDKIEGIVEEINLRSTRIRTFEDTVIKLPNANLIRASVENVSARRTRRQKLSIRVSYDSTADSVNAFCDDIRKWLDANPKVQEGKSLVDIGDLSETSLGVSIQCQFEVATQAEEMELKHALANEIMRSRDAHHVLFAAAPRPLPPVPPEPMTAPIKDIPTTS